MEVVNTITLGGVTVNLPNQSGGSIQFYNDGKTFAYLFNSTGSSMDCVILSNTDCSYGNDHDISFSIAAGATAFRGPFLPSRFNDSSGVVTITTSALIQVGIYNY